MYEKIKKHFERFEGTQTSNHNTYAMLSIDVKKEYPREMWDKFDAKFIGLDWDNNNILCEWYEIPFTNCPADCDNCAVSECEFRD